MQVWKCNDKCYFQISVKTVIGYRIGLSTETPEGKIELISCTKDMPYIMD